MIIYHSTFYITHRGIAQQVEQRSPKPRVVSSILTAPAKKKAIRASGWLFSVKFVPAERVKYAGACEIACGSEIRLRRVKERILFHIATNGSNISQFTK